MTKPKIVDLFCGCGGFGLGAKLAGGDVAIAIDIDQTLQSAYQKNFPATKVLTKDIGLLGSEDWKKLLGDLTIDGVIGGPPCQGYSRMGRGDVNDPRRSLLKHFFRTINIIKPKFFIMENVEGLLDEKNISELEEAIKTLSKRYEVLCPLVLDASKFGAPTKRKRVVVIGFDLSSCKKITVDEILKIKKPISTVSDAIRDLSEPVSQDKSLENYGWASYKSKAKISKYAEKMRKPPAHALGWTVALDHLKQGRLSGNFETIHSVEVKARYASLIPGSIDEISRSKKLEWNGVCPTLRAGTGADKGSYQAVRPIHPESPRVITVREAARLQGFPDWFCFHKTKWHSFRMIGNSVSPLLAERILKLVLSKLIIN